MPLTLFHVLYYACALFYFFSGILLLVSPSTIQHHLPRLFPFLGHFKLERISNALNLIVVGLFLCIIGILMSSSIIWGYFFALVISLWEVYLSIAFYHFHLKDIGQTIVHLIVHITMAFFVGYFILSHFSNEISLLAF